MDTPLTRRTYPRRNRQVVVSLDPTLPRRLIAEGYASFNAIESEHGDGSQSTSVTLYWNNLKISGSTGNFQGHAEMDALTGFLNLTCDKNKETFKKLVGQCSISCTAKPCCVRCSSLLGLLGIRPFGNKTKKTRRAMEQTNYVLPKRLIEAIAYAIGQPEEVVRKITDVPIKNVKFL